MLREDAWNEPPYGSLLIRPLKRSDQQQWHAVRRINREWLAPWEATVPQVSGEQRIRRQTFPQYVSALNRAGRTGDNLMFGMFLDSEFIGQISVANIVYGSLRGASIGYWVAQAAAGRGVAPTAVALLMDYCFDVLRLHRIEINIRPHNAPSLRVAEKLQLRDEGVREKYLHINGEWSDHRTFALTRDDFDGSMVQRYRNYADNS